MWLTDDQQIKKMYSCGGGQAKNGRNGDYDTCMLIHFFIYFTIFNLYARFIY